MALRALGSILYPQPFITAEVPDLIAHSTQQEQKLKWLNALEVEHFVLTFIINSYNYTMWPNGKVIIGIYLAKIENGLNGD